MKILCLMLTSFIGNLVFRAFFCFFAKTIKQFLYLRYLFN